MVLSGRILHNGSMTETTDSIQYEYDFQPDVGEAVDILPGIKWLRLPLPFLLGHINVWLLQDDEKAGSWAIVDTGINSTATRDVWENAIHQYLDDAPVSRVFVTHLHPDHVGCAGWLCERSNVDLYMSRDEYLLCRLLVSDTGMPAPDEGQRFYRAAGYSDDNLNRYVEMFGGFGRMVSPLPQSYQRLHEGLDLKIGGRDWQVIIGKGHSPEHACLFCPELNVLISGDQILPTISSNVSVFPTEPGDNPLADWFESLHRLQKILPEDVLVLPAHGKPFRGAKTRLQALIGEHEAGLDALRKLCRKPQRVIDVFPALFKSKITDNNLMMATGEAIAHLSYLWYAGEVQIVREEDGVRWYQMR